MFYLSESSGGPFIATSKFSLLLKAFVRLSAVFNLLRSDEWMLLEGKFFSVMTKYLSVVGDQKATAGSKPVRLDYTRMLCSMP